MKPWWENNIKQGWENNTKQKIASVFFDILYIASCFLIPTRFGVF